MRLRPNQRQESGVVLIMVLIFISAIGLLSLSLVSFNTTVTRQSFSTTKVQTREMGTNTGLEWGLNELRQGKNGFCFGTNTEAILNSGGRQVRVTCKRQAGSGVPGLNTFALYLNKSGPQSEIKTGAGVGANDPTGDQIKNIVGPVYNAGDWNVKAPLYINGDIFVPGPGGSCNPGATVPNTQAKVIPLYNSFRSCTVPLSVVTPAAVPIPCTPPSTCTPPVVNLPSAASPECKVFSPGSYTSPPDLAPANYFKPGVYHFDFNQVWRINTAIRGGDPRPSVSVGSTQIAAETVESSVTKCAGAPAAVAPYGVVFVFSGGAKMRVTNNGRAELFSYQNGATALPNFVTGGLTGVTDSWSSNSNVNLNQPLIEVGVAQPEFIGHAGIFAPDSAVEFKGSNNAIQKFLNTAVLGRFQMNASASISNSNFGIIVPSGATSKFILMADSCPGLTNGITSNACTSVPAGSKEPPLCSLATVTIYGDADRTTYIDNWRVDRDATTSDPADCSAL